MKNLNKYYLHLASITLIGFTGCTPSTPYIKTPTHQTIKTTTHYEKPTPQKLELYQQTMRTVASGIKHDPKYQRLALDTPEKKSWFKNLTYRLWDRQITRAQFMSEGLAKYPSRRYEFQFVIDGFTRTAA